MSTDGLDNLFKYLLGLGIAFFVIVAIIAILQIIGLYRVFVKAGRKGWYSLIPIYNVWVMLEISSKPGWWLLFTLIPFVGAIIFFVLNIIAKVQLSKNFNQGTPFALGLIFFPTLFLMLLRIW